MAHAPEPDPHSKIRRGREIGGNISLLSNIMLKISCIYWRRSISSCSPRPVVRSTIRGRTKARLRRRLEQSISRFQGRIAGTPCCRGQQPPDTCCRREQFENRCVRLSGALYRRWAGSSAGYAPFVHGCSIGSLAVQFLRVANLKEGSKTYTTRAEKVGNTISRGSSGETRNSGSGIMRTYMALCGFESVGGDTSRPPCSSGRASTRTVSDHVPLPYAAFPRLK